jgi:hypothetical protein
MLAQMVPAPFVVIAPPLETALALGAIADQLAVFEA